MIGRFGQPIYLVNALGNDVFGDSYLSQLALENINTQYVARVEKPSGVASIWVEPDGQNRIIIAPGANNELTVEYAVSAIENIPDLVAVVGQFEIPQKVTAAAFAAAQERGATTIFNPAPSQSIDKELLAVCDWIIPNELEFADLHPQSKSPDSDQVISGLAKLLDTKIVVTLGEAGAAYVQEDGKVVRVPGEKVKAVDTTGAGDSFVGAFTFGLASGLSVEQSVDLGCRTAALGVTREGTQAAYATNSEALNILQEVTKATK
jgi:ribokinase